MGPIDILKELIPSTNNKFTLPQITLPEIKLIIKKLKNSNSTGHDNVSNKIIKRLDVELAPLIMHLINTIIRTGVVPKFF